MNHLASPKRLSSGVDGPYLSEVSSRTGSSDDGREEDFVDVYEIHLENDHTDSWWDELS